jgi:hypothetical protein
MKIQIFPFQGQTFSLYRSYYTLYGTKSIFFLLYAHSNDRPAFFFRGIIIPSLAPETGRTGAGLTDFHFLLCEIHAKYGTILCLIGTGGQEGR